MENFTPISALLGGVLIGISAVMMMVLSGRITGISGICGGLFSAMTGDRGWRLAFLAGLVAAPLLYMAVRQAPPAFVMEAGTPAIIAGGLLVGFGTRLGSGCTSGHGVCGVSRLSPRSIAATFTFMAFGVLTVSVIRHVMGS